MVHSKGSESNSSGGWKTCWICMRAHLDPTAPKVCFDECPYQLQDCVRDPLPLQPGQPARFDSEYEREGTCSLFLLLEPQMGWQHLEIKPRRTKVDFAQTMKELVDVHFPIAPMIRVVLDNLKRRFTC